MKQFKDIAGDLFDAPEIRTPYNYDRDAASIASGLKCEDVSRTKQADANEVDINTIVSRFLKTGQLPSDIRTPLNGDFTDLPDYQTALNMVREAQEAFDAMPVEIRTRFHNDPKELIDFLSDEDNRPQAEKLGLIQARKAAGDVDAATGEILPIGSPATPPQAPQGAKGEQAKPVT